MREEPLSLRFYRRLLKLYPSRFRENYAGVMECAFRDELRESSGIGLWVRLIGDLAVSVPAQFTREIGQDARHTLRLWAIRPWHTAFAVLALAIGIGANTGVFSVVNALLLRALPFRDPERLASFQLFFPPHDSPKHFHEWRTQSTYLADAAPWETGDANLSSAHEWQRTRVAQTSWNFFALLGVQPALGRTFVPGEEAVGSGWGPPGANAVAVISYGLWQSLFGGNRSALGATIRIDGNPLTVIGVAQPGFDYPNKATIWKPAAYSEGNYGFVTIGRLKPGISWNQARARFLIEADRLSPGGKRSGNLKPPTIAPLRDELAGRTKNASLVLMGGVVLILLIACTNVANLLTARTTDRAVELSIRSALGASRARLVQQLFTECVLLSLTAASAGVWVAFGVTSLIARLEPAALATQSYSLLDGRVLCFAVTISLFAGVLFGVLPARYAGQAHSFGTRSLSDTGGSPRVRETLVAAQVMLTVVLVSASISVGRAFLDLMRADRGFDRVSVVTAMVSLQGTTHQTDASRLAYFQDVLARLRRLPGVHAASTTQFLPLDARGFVGGRYRLDGHLASMNSMVVPVMQDYFLAMGDPVLAGREFTQADMYSTANLAIVNDVFAREFGQPSDLIGREIRISRNSWKIIGVVRRMDYMAEGGQTSQVFSPSRSPGWPRTAVVVKVAGRPEDHLAMIRDTIQSVDTEVPLFDVRTMDQRMADGFARPQFYKTAVACFAAFALLLTILGIYGIVAHWVARRTHEMGVRIALGGTPERLRARLLLEGFIPIAAGAIPGVVGASLSGKLLENLVAGAKSLSAPAYVAAILFIALIAAVSIWAASRPLARLDIVEILRTE